MEDMSGTHRLGSEFLRSSWPGGHRRISASQELQLRSFSGPVRGSDSIITHIRWLFLQTEVATARAEIAGTATPRSKYAGKEAGAWPGIRKKLIEGNIGDWKLLKKMETK